MRMNDMSLSLTHGNALNAFKADFDAILKATITKMCENNATEGTITAKMTVMLCNEINDEGEPYQRPTLAHKVSSVVQAKGSIGGVLMGDYALKWDKYRSEYVLVPSSEAQLSLYDLEDPE